MPLQYCEKYGFDSDKIEARLRWLQLSDADIAVSGQLQHAIIQPRATEIIDKFYEWLMALPEARNFLGDEEHVAHLKNTQLHYLLTLGVDFSLPEYFEARLRVGQAHVWVGLSLDLYQSAYRYMSQLIVDGIDLQNSNARAMLEFVHKIMALDMSLAIETYHLAQVRSLEECLDRSQRQQHSLRVAAQTDLLTGVANHEAIIGQLQEILRQPEPVAVVAVMADIDFFKKVNDTYGHVVGDKVLVEVVRRMQAALRSVDSIGRYGGEEFLLLLSGSSLEIAKQVAERIRERVSDQPIHLVDQAVAVTVSLGVSAARPGDTDEVLIARADRALYVAKSAGRNRVEIAEP